MWKALCVISRPRTCEVSRLFVMVHESHWLTYWCLNLSNILYTFTAAWRQLVCARGSDQKPWRFYAYDGTLSVFCLCGRVSYEEQRCACATHSRACAVYTTSCLSHPPVYLYVLYDILRSSQLYNNVLQTLPCMSPSPDSFDSDRSQCEILLFVHSSTATVIPASQMGCLGW